MAISPELQKLLDGAKYNMPAPTPYVKPTITSPKKQEPIFQPLDLNLQMPTPFVQRPVEQDTFAPIPPLVQPGVVASTQTFNLPELPSVLKGTDVGNSIKYQLSELGYGNEGIARQSIESEYDAAEGKGIFNALNTATNSLVKPLQFAGEYIFGDTKLGNSIKEGVNNIRDFVGTSEIANDPSIGIFTPLANISTNISKKRVKKIESIIGTGFQKDRENKRIEKETNYENIFLENLQRPTSPLYQQQVNRNKMLVTLKTEASNDIYPYEQSLDRGVTQEENNNNFEGAVLFDRVKENNIKQHIINQSEFVNRKSQIQIEDPTINDSESEGVLTKQLVSEYGSVNAFLKRGFMKLDGTKLQTTIIDGKSFAEDLYRTPIDFLQDQANEVDRMVTNDAYSIDSNPLPALYANLGRVVSPAVKILNIPGRLAVGDVMGMQTAASDMEYLPTIGFSNRKESVWDVIYKVSQEVFNVVPEVGGFFLGNRLLTPLTGVTALRNIKLGKDVTGMLNTTNVGAISTILKGAGKIIMAETLQSSMVDVNTQNYNNPTNLVANLIGGVIGNGLDFRKLGRDTLKVRDVKDIQDVLRFNASSTKVRELMESGKTQEEAIAVVTKMSDEELVGTKIDSSYIDYKIKEIETLKKAYNEDIKSYETKIDFLKKDGKKLTDEIEIENNRVQISEAEQDLNRYKNIVGKKALEVAAIQKFTMNSMGDQIVDGKSVNLDWFLSAMKTAQPGELPFTIDDAYRVLLGAPRDRNEVMSAVIYDSLLSSIDGYRMSQEISKITGLSPSKPYSLSELEGTIFKESKKASSSDITRLHEMKDGQYKYFVKEPESGNYFLSNEGLAKMNLGESVPVRNMQLNMRAVEEGGESAKYFDTIDVHKETLGIDDIEIQKMKNLDAYNTLLDSVNNFIPCII